MTCEAVQDCVGQAIAAGEGVVYDDTGNAISAQISTDAGNVVSIGTDGGLYAAGVGAALETGCGITGDGTAGSPVAVNPAPWTFACPPQNGQPLGCAGGLLYGAPVQTVWTPVLSGGSLNFTPPAGTSAAGFSRQFTVQLANPDPCRTMRGLAIVTAMPRFTLQPDADVASNIDGTAHHRFSNGVAAARSIYTAMYAWFVLNIPPAGNQTLTWSVGSQVGTGTATITQIVNVVQLMGVSQ